MAFVFAIFKYFRDPDVEAKEKIALLKQACDIRHKDIDSNILAIKENHLRHLESDVSEIKQNLVKIFTILEERAKKYRIKRWYAPS